jgi:DNA-directed RNA polymerase specialized sigma24 family protein
MAVDSFSHSSDEVLNELDPLSRALLDLSVQQGMDDAEIAEVLGTDTESVLEVRVGGDVVFAR